MDCKRALILTILLSLSWCSLASAETEGSSFFDPSKLYYKGYLKNETAIHTHSPHDAAKIKNTFQLEGKYNFSPDLRLFALGRAFWDPAQEIEDDVDLEGWEVYLDVRTESLDVRLGRQQVVWGEADGLRINDLINPQDFKEFIVQDYIDSRIPLWMARLDYYVGDFTFEGLIIPDFKPDRFARGGSEWEFSTPEIPPLFRVEREGREKPDHDFDDWSWGLRIFRIVKGWDLSVSYLYLWDYFPTFHRSLSLPPRVLRPTVTLSPKHHRFHVFGFTYNKAVGPFVLRGEGGYYLNKFLATRDPSEADGFEKRDYLFYMVGFDYHVLHNLDVNLQFIQRVISRYDHELLEDEMRNSFTFYVQSDFFYETLKPRLLIVYGANNGEFWISPEVTYEFTDRIWLTVGGEFFEGGQSDDFFGQFNENDQVYFELKLSFD